MGILEELTNPERLERLAEQYRKLTDNSNNETLNKEMEEIMSELKRPKLGNRIEVGDNYADASAPYTDNELAIQLKHTDDEYLLWDAVNKFPQFRGIVIRNPYATEEMLVTIAQVENGSVRKRAITELTRRYYPHLTTEQVENIRRL